MKKEFNIYAGLGGGFGGAEYCSTILAEDINEATNYAYECAREEYEMYEGNRRIKSWSDVAFDLGFNPDETDMTVEEEEEVSQTYNEEVEDWICYYAVLTSEDNIPEENLIREHNLCKTDSM